MSTDERAHLARALAVTPLASQTRSKAPGRVGPPLDAGLPFPLFADSGLGAHLYGADGRRYLDVAGANAAVPLGYGFEPVRAAVAHAAEFGPLLSLPSVREAEVSERFLATCAPWAAQVRWVRTGSEATHAAYRIAKELTGRRTVLMGDWAYHGWHEWTSDLQARGFVYPYGFDPTGWQHPGEYAAIFVEPHRWLEMDRTWLRALRDYCTRHGIALVFDEMVYGLRWAKGGGAEHYGVTPDLACFGKALGNGVPVACVCGTAEAMRHVEASGVSGTYGGDLLGLAAAEAVLQTYAKQDVIGELWANGQRTWRAFAAEAPADFLEGFPVHWRLRLPPETVWRAQALAAAQGVLFHQAANNASAAMAPAEASRAGHIIGTAVRRALEGA